MHLNKYNLSTDYIHAMVSCQNYIITLYIIITDFRSFTEKGHVFTLKIRTKLRVKRLHLLIKGSYMNNYMSLIWVINAISVKLENVTYYY